MEGETKPLRLNNESCVWTNCMDKWVSLASPSMVLSKSYDIEPNGYPIKANRFLLRASWPNIVGIFLQSRPRVKRSWRTMAHISNWPTLACSLLSWTCSQYQDDCMTTPLWSTYSRQWWFQERCWLRRLPCFIFYHFFLSLWTATHLI